MKKETEEIKVKETKNKKVLEITEEEFNRPMIRRKIVELVQIRASFHSTEPFLPISEAEFEIIKEVPLFTPLKDYNNPKFPNEVGKLRSQRVVIVSN
ncbi:MAG TPA: hypothetical protein VGB37_12755 [Candidatus Lokiarchaeia archaeon]